MFGTDKIMNRRNRFNRKLSFTSKMPPYEHDGSCGVRVVREIYENNNVYKSHINIILRKCQDLPIFLQV